MKPVFVTGFRIACVSAINPNPQTLNLKLMHPKILG